MKMIGKYRVIRQLGAGNFGTVYLAEDPRLAHEVAIKVLSLTSSTRHYDKLFRQRFLQEARILRQLSANANIVELYDFDEMTVEGQSQPYYVMPYLPQSLTDLIGLDISEPHQLNDLPAAKRPRRLPVEQTLVILQQLLHALSAVHGAGLLHLDLKPANILFNVDGDLQLADFGIAQLAQSNQHSYDNESLSMGSPHYISPEQRQQGQKATAASDIYAVGVLAYRLLTGALPKDKLVRIRQFVPEMEERLENLLLSCLNTDPSQRPNNAQHLAEEFGRIAMGRDANGLADGGTEISPPSIEFRSELQPLVKELTPLLRHYGEIPASQRARIQLMADMAKIERAELEVLVQQLVQNMAPQLQPLHAWLAGLNKQLSQGRRKLSPGAVNSLLETGQQLGLDKLQLQDILAEKGLCKAEPSSSKHHSAGGATDTDSGANNGPKNSAKKRRPPIVLPLLLLGAAAYWLWSTGDFAPADIPPSSHLPSSHLPNTQIPNHEPAQEVSPPSSQHQGQQHQGPDWQQLSPIVEPIHTSSKTALMAEVEQQLRRIGYPLKPSTEAAIKAFQRDNQMPVNGEVSEGLLKQLLSNPGTRPVDHYVLSNQGTVSDKQSSLMWMRCSLGLEWQPASHRCEGAPVGFYPEQARSQSHSFAGYNDWRLPSLRELKSIIARDSHPKLNGQAFPENHWQSDKAAMGYATNGSWWVDFSTGRSGVSADSNRKYYVRLVREQ